MSPPLDDSSNGASNRGSEDVPDPELVPRGPVETLAPSRTALVLVAAAGLLLAVLATAGVLRTAPEQTLASGETLVEDGPFTVAVGDVLIETIVVDGPWIVRERCPRWVQLTAFNDESTQVHLVWLDAVPGPSTAPPVTMDPPPADIAGWWRTELALDVRTRERAPVDEYAAAWHELRATPEARRADGLVACGDPGAPAATGMLGPAAGFAQQAVVIDLGEVPLVGIAAAWTGGDLVRAVAVLDAMLDRATLRPVAP